MAPIKLDEQLKEKLEQRTLQPSSKAWSQLADRLDKEDQSKNKIAFWWFGIAASIALIIAVSLPFFNSNAEKAQPIIVDTNNTIDKGIEKEEVIGGFKTQEEPIAEDDKHLELVTNKNPATSKERMQQEQKEILKSTIVDESVTMVDELENSSKELKINKAPISKLKTFEDIKIQDVVAEIQKMKDTPSGVTDREIDSLLKVVHKEILTQRIYNDATKTVDADALLQDVEADLEQSFRTKVFEALKTNYNKVKTAVAERNN